MAIELFTEIYCDCGQHYNGKAKHGCQSWATYNLEFDEMFYARRATEYFEGRGWKWDPNDSGDTYCGPCYEALEKEGKFK